VIRVTQSEAARGKADRRHCVRHPRRKAVTRGFVLVDGTRETASEAPEVGLCRECDGDSDREDRYAGYA
jgi:hypothetical protein